MNGWRGILKFLRKDTPKDTNGMTFHSMYISSHNQCVYPSFTQILRGKENKFNCQIQQNRNIYLGFYLTLGEYMLEFCSYGKYLQ